MEWDDVEVMLATDADACASRLVGIHTCVSGCDSGVVSGAGGYSTWSWCMWAGGPDALLLNATIVYAEICEHIDCNGNY